MLKNILELNGAQQLSKKEQKEIKGSKRRAPECAEDEDCGINVFCCDQYCQFTPCQVI